jgi:hypothetical protein
MGLGEGLGRDEVSLLACPNAFTVSFGRVKGLSSTNISMSFDPRATIALQTIIQLIHPSWTCLHP